LSVPARPYRTAVGSDPPPFMASAQLRGWLWSAVIHGTLLGAVVWGGAALPQPEVQEVFQWEVQLTTDTPSPVSSMETDRSTVRAEPLAEESVVASWSASGKTPAHMKARREISPTTASGTDSVVFVENEVVPIQSVAVATKKERVSLAMDVQPLAIDSSADTSPGETNTDVERNQPTASAQELNVLEAGAVATARQSRDELIAGGGPQAEPVASEQASSRRDFGWVGLALRARVEEIKRYSLDARLNEWEGRAVVAVEILADGRIINSRIVESSGNLRLDEDACALVSRASPLKLARSLEVEQLTVRIPIVFSLH
jgi:protein TonB